MERSLGGPLESQGTGASRDERVGGFARIPELHSADSMDRWLSVEDKGTLRLCFVTSGGGGSIGQGGGQGHSVAAWPLGPRTSGSAGSKLGVWSRSSERDSRATSSVPFLGGTCGEPREKRIEPLGPRAIERAVTSSGIDARLHLHVRVRRPIEEGREWRGGSSRETKVGERKERPRGRFSRGIGKEEMTGSRDWVDASWSSRVG